METNYNGTMTSKGTATSFKDATLESFGTETMSVSMTSRGGIEGMFDHTAFIGALKKASRPLDDLSERAHREHLQGKSIQLP